MAKIDTREIQIPSILKVEKDLLRRIGASFFLALISSTINSR